MLSAGWNEPSRSLTRTRSSRWRAKIRSWNRSGRWRRSNSSDRSAGVLTRSLRHQSLRAPEFGGTLSDLRAPPDGCDGPPSRQQFTVGRLRETGIDQQHNAPICLGSNHPASRLNDAIEARISIGVFEAEAILL